MHESSPALDRCPANDGDNMMAVTGMRMTMEELRKGQDEENGRGEASCKPTVCLALT